MAFYIVHAGTKLYKVDTAGGAMELTLPAGVTISDVRPAKFAILDRTIVVVNAPSVNLQIDANLVVRILTPQTPANGPTAAAGAAGNLNGSYRWLVTFRIMDGTTVVSESAASDPSAAVTLTDQQGNLSNIPISTDPGVNARGIYRTEPGGTEFFFVDVINDNVTTVFTDDLADETLAESDLIDPDLGAPPGTDSTDYAEDATTWSDRIWLLGHNEPDIVRYSGLGVPYAFNPENGLTAKPIGADLQGVTGFVKRREELGVGKRRKFLKIIGTGAENDDGTVDYEIIGIQEEVGLWAPASAVTIRDKGYFLAEDGVYRYGPDGIQVISDDQVRAWFTTDTYFNRAMFPQAFANFNQALNGYQLFLCPPNSETFNYWILFDLKTERWFGPHKTDGLAPTCAGVFEDNDQLVVPVLGAEDGQVWEMNQTAFRDGDDAIDMLIRGKRHSQDDPDTTKFWGRPTVFTKKGETAGTLIVRSRVGSLEADQGPISVTSMSRVGSTVTVTTATEHGFGNLTDITIDGADQTEYNASWTITRISATIFTFTISTTPTTPATGTITALLGIKSEQTHDLTLSREVLGRLGIGELCEIEFENAEIDQGCEIYGYEVDPVNVIGRR